MGRPGKKVAIVIPAYNEERIIRSVVLDLVQTFSKSKYNPAIIVVDDGSRDRTADEARGGGAVVIRHIINSGSGSATATGLRYAERQGFDIAATCDADGQHAAEDVLAGINTILDGDTDLLIGSRLLDRRAMSRVKIIGNRGLSFITYVLFGISVTDSQSGLRIFSGRALQSLSWKTSGYEFCSEMLWRAKQLGLHVAEFPIQTIYTDYSIAKGQNNWNAFNIVRTLLKRRLVEFFSE